MTTTDRNALSNSTAIDCKLIVVVILIVLIVLIVLVVGQFSYYSNNTDYSSS